MLNGTFEEQCLRVNSLVKDGCVTPELGSLILHYYALGRHEAAGEHCDVASFAKKNFNIKHDETIQAFRKSKPAALKL